MCCQRHNTACRRSTAPRLRTRRLSCSMCRPIRTRRQAGLPWRLSGTTCSKASGLGPGTAARRLHSPCSRPRWTSSSRRHTLAPRGSRCRRQRTGRSCRRVPGGRGTSCWWARHPVASTQPAHFHSWWRRCQTRRRRMSTGWCRTRSKSVSSRCPPRTPCHWSSVNQAAAWAARGTSGHSQTLADMDPTHTRPKALTVAQAQLTGGGELPLGASMHTGWPVAARGIASTHKAR